MLCEYIFSFVTDSWARNVSCSFEFHVITLAEPFQYRFPLLYLQFIQLVCFLEQCCQYSECSSSTAYHNCVFLTILLTHTEGENIIQDDCHRSMRSWLLTTEPRVLSQATLHETHEGQNGTGASFSECLWLSHTIH